MNIFHFQDGYDTAKVQYIKDSVVPSDKFADLVILHDKVYNKASKWIRSLKPKVLAEVERLIGVMPIVEKDWPSLPDGPSWAWWLMPILPLSSQLQVRRIFVLREQGVMPKVNSLYLYKSKH